MAPTGSIVKSAIESAVIATTELEQTLILIMSNAELDTQSARSKAIGDLFPDVAKIEYFSREVWDHCEGSVIEAPALRLRQDAGDLRNNLVAAIQVLDSTGFVRSLGQMLLAIGEIKISLDMLEKERFENSKMRRA
jgi:hypothetical protein